MKWFDRTRVVYFVLGFFFTALFLFFSYSRVFDEFEYSTYDFRYKLRPAQYVNDKIVIIEIDDKVIEKLGKWPFPRNYHALLIKALKQAGAKTIVLDIFFSEQKEYDEELAGAVKEANNVYIPYVFELDKEKKDKTRIYAKGYAASLIDVLKKDVKGTGFVNIDLDSDGTIRRFTPFIEYEGKFYPHLTMAAALNDLGYQFDEVKIIPAKEMVISGGLKIPLSSNSTFPVDYPAKWGKAFRHYSYLDIIDSYLSDVTKREAPIDLSEFKDTICFVGLTATGVPDIHPTPLEPLYPGIGVHASVYNSILKRSFLQRLNAWWNLLILIAMWIITAYITSKSRRRFAIISIVFIMFGYAFFAGVLFWLFGKWIDVFYPLVTMAGVYAIFTFKKYMAEIYKREFIEKELSIAKEIQDSFLPTQGQIPLVGGLDVGAKMITARQIGGDLYGMVQLDNKRLGVMIGDVSGKGVPAALFMAKVVGIFKIFENVGTAGEVLKSINNRLVENSGSNLFVTMTYIVFNTAIRTATFAIGGHLPTIFVSPEGNVELLSSAEGMPLGLMDSNYTVGMKEYEKGSVFLLYSDGVTEAMNAKEEMFGEERLLKLAQNFKSLSAKEIVDVVHKAVADFAGKTKQYDDITIVAIKT